MITKEHIIKMAKHVVKRDKGFPDRKLIHPTRDWTLALLVIAVLFVAASAYIGYNSLTQFNDTNQIQVTDSTVTVYKQDVAREVLGTYGDRSAQFEALRNDTRHVVPDPVEEEASEEDDSEEEVVDENLNPGDTPEVAGAPLVE